MTEELRQRVTEIEKVKQHYEDAVDSGFQDDAQGLYGDLCNEALYAFPLLVSEVERLEAENERLKKERKHIACLFQRHTKASVHGQKEEESEAFWAMYELLERDFLVSAKQFLKEG